MRRATRTLNGPHAYVAKALMLLSIWSFPATYVCLSEYEYAHAGSRKTRLPGRLTTDVAVVDRKLCMYVRTIMARKGIASALKLFEMKKLVHQSSCLNHVCIDCHVPLSVSPQHSARHHSCQSKPDIPVVLKSMNKFVELPSLFTTSVRYVVSSERTPQTERYIFAVVDQTLFHPSSLPRRRYHIVDLLRVMYLSNTEILVD